MGDRRSETASAKIRDLRRKAGSGAPPGDAGVRCAPGARTSSTPNWTSLQGETPLMRVCVDDQIVGEVISGWTGIPRRQDGEGRDPDRAGTGTHLGKRVIGQDHALELIAPAHPHRAPAWKTPASRWACSCWSGPSGVGKTETALALSDLLYGGERNLITINMSEFQEAHTVSTLKGSPPGYVGYGEGGVLTEAVRRRPYSVVLLDEVEKAHPDVLELFFQVFDKGQMEDGEGREIDFKNTIIILTTNAGTDTMMKLCADPETMPTPEGLVKALKPELNKIFKPAFLGRMVIMPYYPIRDEALKLIIRLKLGKIKRRLHGEPQDRADLRRRADRRSGQPLHGSRKRRAQRGQHIDEHAAAGDLAPAAHADGRGREDDHAARRRRRGRVVRLLVEERTPRHGMRAHDRCVGLAGRNVGLLPDVPP